MVRPADSRKRNVWFLEMGARESKVKSSPKTPTRADPGSGTRAMTSGHSTPVRSTNPRPVLVWPDSSARWRSLYDVYVCHSRQEDDCSYAMEMLAYLEQQPENLRCFLPMRDMLAGSPIPTEMCSGLENSHCWVMILTPHFLSDNWCKYQMHQFLAQAPCSNGRLIPVMIGLSFAQLPSELKHMYVFKGAFTDKSVLVKVKGAILTYLTTVTTEQSSINSPSSRTPGSSQNTSKPGGNSLGESSGTHEANNDMSSRSPKTPETTPDLSMRRPVTHETTPDLSMRRSVTHETTPDLSMRRSVTHETTCLLQDKYSDFSLSPCSHNRDVCTDCECFMTMTKDSFSPETQVTQVFGQ